MNLERNGTGLPFHEILTERSCRRSNMADIFGRDVGWCHEIGR